MVDNGDIPEPRSVLIIKPSALGDVATALPVLRGLRRTFGRDVRIDWLLAPGCAPLVAEDPDLDNVLIFDRKRWGTMWFNPFAAWEFVSFCRQLRRSGYDWVIDLQGLFRSGFLTFVSRAAVRGGFSAAREMAWLAYNHRLSAAEAPAHTVDRNIALARLLGVDARPEDFRLPVPPSSRDWVEEFVSQHGSDFVIVAPATRWPTKLYPANHWREVVQQLVRRTQVVLVAGPGEEHLTAGLAHIEGVINLAGQTTVPQLTALIDAGRGLVSCDSATMNIATALGAPQVTLIGPTEPARTGPYGQAEAVVQAPVPCRMCLKRNCSHIACMELILPVDVLAAVEERILSGESAG